MEPDKVICYYEFQKDRRVCNTCQYCESHSYGDTEPIKSPVAQIPVVTNDRFEILDYNETDEVKV